MIYGLAFHLRMPVYKLLDEMPYTELLEWQEYFKKHPVGMDEDYRFFVILRSLGMKEKPETIFNSFKLQKKYEQENQSAVMLQSLRRSKMFAAMAGAIGGHKLV